MMAKLTPRFFNKTRFVSFAPPPSRSIFAVQSTDSKPCSLNMKNENDTTKRFPRPGLAALAMALFCAVGSLSAQGFEVSFGGPKNDYGRAILQTSDLGYLEVGSTEGELGDDNDLDIFIVRTDVDGTPLWTKSYDAGFLEQADDVVATPDGGFLVVGYCRETSTSPEKTYLLKISGNGRTRFERTLGAGGVNERGRQIIITQDEGFLVTGYRERTADNETNVLAIRLDEDGNEVWRREIPAPRGSKGIGAVETPTGFVLGANQITAGGVANDLAIYGIDHDGNVTWTKTYGDENDNEQIEDVVPTPDGQHLILVGSTNNFNTAFMAKVDLNGDTLWLREYDASPFDDEFRGVSVEADGEHYVAVGQTVPTPANLDVLMVKVRAADGRLVWQRRLGDVDALDIAEDLAPTRDGGYALAAFNSRALSLFNDLTLFRTDDFGDLQTNYLRGRVYHPADGTCRPEAPGDRGLAGWLVQAESATATFVGSTDSLGNYDLRVDTAVYTVTLLPRNDRWNVCAPGVLTADLTVPYDSVFHDFAVTPAIACPLLEVRASATPAVQCDTQRITLHYGNSGTDAATNTSVVFTLDSNLTLVSAFPAVDQRIGRDLIFETGYLAIGAAGKISILATLPCSGVTDGQAISSMAAIYPIVGCAPVDPDWDGSSVVVTGRCDRTEGVSFELTNVGTQDMSSAASYIIVEDIVLTRRVNFQLDAAETITVLPEPVGVQNPSSTYRLIAEQSAGHPGNAFPTAVVEGCRADAFTGFQTGYVAQFSDNDGDANLDILTQEIIVFDDGEPVRMTVFPRGYQDSLIFPETDLEFTVFFGLPDNDFTERVVIRDTLPEQLDLNSLEMGAASHPYESVLYQGGILKITFDSIRFFSGGGAGEADAVLNRGYVTYRISQKPNIPLGSVIRNRAAVYFDYQSPFLTGQTRQVVGCTGLFEDGNCLVSNTLNLPPLEGVTTNIYPNPVLNVTTVTLTGTDELSSGQRTLRLFDVHGRLLARHDFRGNAFRLERPAAPAGVYFYEVTGAGYLLGRGKVVLQ